jgi:class 3 adenylate cyclase
MMGFTLGKKLALATGASVLTAGAAVAALSAQALEERLEAGLRAELESAAALLASRVGAELRHVAEKGRWLAMSSSPATSSALQDGDAAMRLTLHYRAEGEGRWTVARTWLQNEDDDRLDRLDIQYPMDLTRAARGDADAVQAALRDGTPVLRVAVPVAHRASGERPSRVVTAELPLDRLQAAFVSAGPALAYLVDRHGRVVVQSDPGHFTPGERVDPIPVVRAALSSQDAPNGFLPSYSEMPGGRPRVGAYHRVGHAGLAVVAEAPRSLIGGIVSRTLRTSLFAALGFAFLAAALALLGSWRWLGGRLARLSAAAARAMEGHGSAKLPNRDSGDEIGALSRRLARALDDLHGRLRSPATFQKFVHHRATLHRLQRGQLPLQGERREAYVLSCRLAGLETVAAQADPAELVQQLNRFAQAASSQVEEHAGVVDRAAGGSLVAFWGIPDAGGGDAERALSTCLALRRCVKTLNESLAKAGLPEVRLSAALHFGEVVAAQFGPASRPEYTVAGAGMDMASRIQGYAESLGTDLLVTGAVADRAPKWFSLSRAAPADDGTPELHELVGASPRKAAAPQSEPAAAAAPAKRKRGRPRKKPLEPPATAEGAEKVIEEAEAAERAIEEDLRKVA